MLASAALIKTYTSNGVKLALIRYADGGETVIKFEHLPKFIQDDLKTTKKIKP
jgi:hypothetical protein